MLDEAVQRHLVADVPVGVFLSGGVDSGGIAALAARGRSAPVRTLTITFDEQEFSEAEHARTFAERSLVQITMKSALRRAISRMSCRIF